MSELERIQKKDQDKKDAGSDYDSEYWYNSDMDKEVAPEDAIETPEQALENANKNRTNNNQNNSIGNK